MSNIWLYQHPQNSSWLSKTVLLKLQEQYKQSWSASINESPKCLHYRLFKTEHKFENYLKGMTPKMRKTLIDYRLCNNCQSKQADGPISVEISESVNYVILVLLVMNFTKLWNVVSLTLIGKSFYHISTRKLLTASHIYLMILTPGD